jgi:hypothetical protein
VEEVIITNTLMETSILMLIKMRKEEDLVTVINQHYLVLRSPKTFRLKLSLLLMKNLLLELEEIMKEQQLIM